MNEMISRCGLLCSSCQIYLASQEKDKTKKNKMIFEIISLCKTHYGVDYNYEDINECDGCVSLSGKLFSGCNNCKIRSCVIEKGIYNCAYCNEYPCNELNGLFKNDPGVKVRLDKIRSENF